MSDQLPVFDGIRPTVWYKLRITLSDEKYDPTMPTSKFTHMINAAVEFLDIVRPYIADSKVIGGVEVHNKYGLYTYPHVHIHFKSQMKKDTILKQLKRKYEEAYGEPMIGTKRYSFKPETNVDEVAFYRYPLKQYETMPRYCLYDGFDYDEMDEMRRVAHAQYKIGVEVNDAKKTKKDEHTSIYERCCVELDKLSSPRPLDIILGIQEIYLKEKRPINNQTIKGYSLTYMLTKGIVSKEKNAKNILSQLNI